MKIQESFLPSFIFFSTIYEPLFTNVFIIYICSYPIHFALHSLHKVMYTASLLKYTVYVRILCLKCLSVAHFLIYNICFISITMYFLSSAISMLSFI